MEMTYREILKAKAAALAKEAEFGSDETVKATLQDLADFAKPTLFKLRDPSFHLGRDFYDDLAADLERTR